MRAIELQSKLFGQRLLSTWIFFGVACIHVSHVWAQDSKRESSSMLDVSELIDGLIESIPSFEAVWEVDEIWAPDPEFADYLDAKRPDQLSDYADESDTEARKEADGLIKAQNDEIRKGLNVSYTLRLKFFGMKNYVVEYKQDGWEFPIEYFSAGDGVIYEVNHINRVVRISPFERYLLSSKVGGIPQILLYGLTTEGQGFSLDSIGSGATTLKSNPLQSEWRSRTEALITAKVSPDTMLMSQFIRFYRSQAKGEKTYADKPVTWILFSDYQKVPNSTFMIAKKTDSKRITNTLTKKVLRETWSLISLVESRDDIHSCAYIFKKGYRVIDQRTDPYRIFKSDEILGNVD